MGTNVITMEDALLMTGFGKYNILLLLFCGNIMMGMICETLGLSYIIPAAQCDLELTLTQKGWLGAIPFVGIIVSSHMWGWLADTRGRKPVIMWSMGIGATFSILSSLCPNLISFAIMRFIAAIFIAGPHAIIVPYLGEFNSPVYRDRMVTLVSAFISVGTLILPALAWFIYPFEFKIPIEFLGIIYKPWRTLTAVLALPYLISSIIIIRAHESPKFLARMGKTKEAMEVIKSIYFKNKGHVNDSFENIELEDCGSALTKSSVLRSMWDQTVPLFKPPLLPFMLISCFVQFGTFGSTNGFYLWIPEILNRITNLLEFNNTDGTVCEILAPKLDEMANFSIPLITECFDKIHVETFHRSMILGAIYCPVLVGSAFVVHIFGKKKILMAASLVSGLAAYAIYWVGNQNVTLVLLAVIQMDSVSIGMMNAIVVENFPTNYRAMAVSLSLMIGRSGSILGSNLIGYLVEVYCPSTFFLFGSLLLACCGVCFLLPRTPKELA